MDKTIVKTTIKTCQELCADGWDAKARIEEQSKNGTSNWMVGLFFTKDTKQKFAGVTVKSKERAKELLESFRDGLDKYREGLFEEVEAEDDDDDNLEEEGVEEDYEDYKEKGMKRCGCGPHIDREKVGDHLICKHGTCLCGWQDDGVRQLGKLFGVEVFAKTKDKKVLEKINKHLKRLTP